jgi:DNA mismatch repair protein MutS
MVGPNNEKSNNNTKVINHWTDLNEATLPPMMKEWYKVKKKYPDFLVAWRMGDFFEFFYSPDVDIVAKIGLTKTLRGSGPNRHPLAGIPHKATQHFKSLIKMGVTVVMVDQLEDPKLAQSEKRLVKRGVVRILSPGTAIDESLLDSTKNNYLVSVSQDKKGYGVSFIDLSCGDFFCTEFTGKNTISDLISIIARFEAVECILPPAIYTNKEFITILKDSLKIIIKEHDMYAFQYDNAYKSLLEHFGTKSLDGFGISDLKIAICAAGGIISFLNETQKTILPNIKRIKRYMKEELMYLDSITQKNLEILKNLQDGTEYGSLNSVINKTITPMGARLQKKIIVQPLISKQKIEDRLDTVELFKEDTLLRNDLREHLSQIGDMERIISRINYSRSSNGRDLVYLKNALNKLPDIKHILAGTKVKSLEKIVSSINDYSEIISLVETALKVNPR